MYAADEFRDLDRLTDRLLREAGARYTFPTPVDDIVEAQHLRIAGDEESLFAPAVLAEAPLWIREKVCGFKHKLVAGLVRPDRMIHLDAAGLDVQKRFAACHEVGHDLQRDVEQLYLDSRETLSPTLHDWFERGANYAATRLLFQGNIFLDEARGLTAGFASVKCLADLFGASIHSTLWLMVETALEPLAAFVLRSPFQDNSGELRFGVKTAYTSESFNREFGVRETPPQTFSSVDHGDLRRAWDTLRLSSEPGTGELTLPNRRGEQQPLHFELFTNRYALFLLVTRPALRSIH